MADKVALSEDQLQGQCYEWHWNTFPSERRMFFCVMQNTFGDAIRGALNRALGVTPGVADTIYIAPSGVVWFVEFKFGKGVQSPEQLDFEAKLKARGGHYILIRTFNQFKEFIYGFRR